MKTLLLRNNWCDFACSWCNKTDGSDGHSFAKGEIFEVPEIVERKDSNGNVREIKAIDLLQKMFPIGIEIAKGAVSAAQMKEKDDEIARLKAELAATKKQKGKKGKNTEIAPAAEANDESSEESDKTDESEDSQGE